jgi:hypothetical protein
MDRPCRRPCSISSRSASVRCLFLAITVPFICAPPHCRERPMEPYAAENWQTNCAPLPPRGRGRKTTLASTTRLVRPHLLAD